MLKYLLDTNIVIYVVKRRLMEVLGLFNEHAGRMAMSAMTLSELFHGAEKSAGQPIGVNDLHIAAHARSEGLVVVTHHVSELARVPGLMVENWVTPLN